MEKGTDREPQKTEEYKGQWAHRCLGTSLVVLFGKLGEESQSASSAFFLAHLIKGSGLHFRDKSLALFIKGEGLHYFQENRLPTFRVIRASYVSEQRGSCLARLLILHSGYSAHKTLLRAHSAGGLCHIKLNAGAHGQGS